MDNNYWTVRREEHEVIKTLNEEDLHNYDIVSNLHNQVLELGPIDPLRRGGLRGGNSPNIAWGIIGGHERSVRNYFVEDPVYVARMVKGLDCPSVCF